MLTLTLTQVPVKVAEQLGHNRELIEALNVRMHGAGGEPMGDLGVSSPGGGHSIRALMAGALDSAHRSRAMHPHQLWVPGAPSALRGAGQLDIGGQMDIGGQVDVATRDLGRHGGGPLTSGRALLPA